jgi:DNA-binding LacI/PurR family transcriptional regulator
MSVPQLTTIDHHLDSRALLAVDYIVKNRAGLKQFSRIKKIEYQPQLIVRSSAAAPGRKTHTP